MIAPARASLRMPWLVLVGRGDFLRWCTSHVRSFPCARWRLVWHAHGYVDRATRRARRPRPAAGPHDRRTGRTGATLRCGSVWRVPGPPCRGRRPRRAHAPPTQQTRWTFDRHQTIRKDRTVRLTGTGHASMRIDTAAGSILCDPWVNPAYFASWFPFPDNSQLDWEPLGHVDYLYVSHLHRDHFDAKHLTERSSRRRPVLLPEYPTSRARGRAARARLHQLPQDDHERGASSSTAA